jgi:short subunit dehydrogenase-like uncharacterized protein
MHTNSFLLYGANGYTGELITRFANQYNLQPILAGRREDVIKPMAEKFNLPYKIFDVNDAPALLAAMQGVKVIVNAAGPFEFTAKQIIEACLQTGTHYLDINGDMMVFEMIQRYDAQANKAGIMLMPAVGFDVVPTDCMALFLKKLLPDAVSLKIAFASLGGGISHGTAITTASKLGEPGVTRRDGKLIDEPVGKKGMQIDFGVKKLFVMSIPWGDLFTAHITTGISNIETFTGISKSIYLLLKFQNLFNPLLRTSIVRNFVKKKIKQRPAGPDDAQRNKAISLVWGQVVNSSGKTVTARLSGPEAYTLTAYSTLLVTQKVLSGNFSSGYQTPAGVYGEDLVMEIKGVKREVILS